MRGGIPNCKLSLLATYRAGDPAPLCSCTLPMQWFPRPTFYPKFHFLGGVGVESGHLSQGDLVHPRGIEHLHVVGVT